MLYEYLTWLDEQGRSPATVSAYASDLRGIDPTRAGLLHYRASVQGFKPATAARKIASARSYCRWLGPRAPEDWRRILAPPTVERTVPLTSPADLARLLIAPSGLTAAGLRDRAMLHILLGAGCRASELVGLDVGDVAGGYLLVAAGTPKEREIPLGQEAMAALGGYLLVRSALNPGGSPALFVNHRGQRLTRQGGWLILQWHCRRVGIPPLSASALRHAAALRMVAEQSDLGSVQYLLGHASAATIQPYVQAARRVA